MRDARLPLRLRLWGFCLSRCESVHREVRAAARTRLGFLLIAANLVLWPLALLERLFPC